VEDSNQLSKKSIEFIQNTSEYENNIKDKKMSGAYLDGITKGMGPNLLIKNNQSDLYTLKLNDNNYDKLFDTVKGILNNEMKNPNIEKMHLINA
jgi:phosphoribosylformylglycinamidine (FGAM) synthase PurS component